MENFSFSYIIVLRRPSFSLLEVRKHVVACMLGPGHTRRLILSSGRNLAKDFLNR